jgi:hypothetical protein
MVPVPQTAAPDVEARAALIQALIPVAWDRVCEELQAEVERLAGKRYERCGRPPGHVRWTAQRGSIYLADQKIPLQVPRVRDRLRNLEVPLVQTGTPSERNSFVSFVRDDETRDVQRNC